MNKLLTGLAACLLVSSSAGCVASLNRAARQGDTARVSSLLDKGADIEAPSPCCSLGCAAMPPLQCAINSNNTETVKLFLDRGASLSNTGTFGYPPLALAAVNSTPAVLKLLLDRGADVNGTTTGGDTALDSVARSRDGEKARMLVAAGADLDSAVAKQAARGDSTAVAFLQAFVKTRRQAAEGLSKEELASIVQAAVEGATKAQRQDAQPQRALESDIDKVSFRLAERPHDFALVVGIEKYSDLPEARFAARDGEAVRDHLLALGFPSRNVVHLSGEKAGYKGIEKFVETWLPRNVEEDSRVIFYFSGHGAPEVRSGRSYLLPYDGDPDFLENTGYPLERLYQKLSELKAREVIVVLDACFSGAGGRSALAKGARPLVAKVDTGVIPQKLTVFAAASGEQITSVLEDQGHGTFTYYFLKGLGGGAKDPSGRVTAKALHGYLDPKVQDAARRQNRDQEPVLHGLGDKELVRF